jgi:hypothetical protein
MQNFEEFPSQGAHGILVPGGFGDRGVQGKILAAKYARENNVPYLGICLGMQIAVIEFARSVMNLCGANSTEFDPATKTPCVIFMPEVICLTGYCIYVLIYEKIVLCLLYSFNNTSAGLQNSYGRNNAPWFKEDIFPRQKLQIC